MGAIVNKNTGAELSIS